MRKTLIFLVAALGLTISGVVAQGSLTLSISASSPHSFDTVGGATAGVGVILDAASNLVRSEPLQFVLTTTPTPLMPPPANLQPRPLQLWVAPELVPPMNLSLGSLFLDFAGAVAPVALLDSFSNPFQPVFGPPLSGSSNTISFAAAAEFYDPSYSFPLPTLVFQAVAQDSPGHGLLLSGGLRLNLIDPDATSDPSNPGATFAPVITGITPQFASGLGIQRPLGPEAGGNTVSLQGSNFPAQSNWISFPPSIMFGSEPATNVAVLSNTLITCTVPPTPFPTAPPNTSACLVDVTLQNNPHISPSALPVLSPAQYLYLTPQAPAILGFNQNHGSPEGREARTIQGSWFLTPGERVRFTSLANPALQTVLVNPTLQVLSGNQLSLITPPFCTGNVEVEVINCDEQVSNAMLFTYNPLPPVFLSGSPLFATLPPLQPLSTPAAIDTGSSLAITGTGFLTSTSPLASAPTVDPSLFHPTRVFIAGNLEPGLVPATSTTISGTTASNDQSGLFRPGLGYKTLTLENPPCVSPGNAGPITTSTTILIQDDAPPAFNEVYPAIGPHLGGITLHITGSNFFSLQGGTQEQDFSLFADANGDITNLDPTQLVVPAVSFGQLFAPWVRLISENELEVQLPKLPSPPAGSQVVAVRVYNPDSQNSTAPATFIYVPPLVPRTPLDPASPDLDTPKLEDIARGNPIPGGAGNPPAVILVTNPSPTRDFLRDPARNTSLVPAGSSYDYVFLFNTRVMGAVAQPRFFNFGTIDLPATLTLDQPGLAQVLLLDPTQVSSPPPAPVAIPPGTVLRVIIKAAGFSLAPDGRVLLDPQSNFPLWLGASRDFQINAMIHLGGDAFLLESFLASNRFRAQVDRTLPPAGGGQGGRGGAWFPEGLTTIPGPNFGASPSMLQGGEGSPPPLRAPLALPQPSTGTGGMGALGSFPIALTVGAGGGAGYAGPGSAGQSGTSLGGLGGAAFGNASALFASPAPLGIPADDRIIFGNTPADMDLFALGSALQTGLIYGGSGGGGGGGGVAIIVPAICLGGRGGNGGGALVALSNGQITLGQAGIILAHGEAGYPGVDAFPIANGAPIIPLCVPGEGGSGTGGTILALAVADICFENGPPTRCPQSGLPLLPGFDTSRPQVDARGGPPGPQPGFQGIQGLFGGGAGNGRVRFAINALSPYLSDPGGGLVGFQTALEQMLGDPCNTLPPLMPLILPAPENFCSAPPPAAFYAYPAAP